MIIVYQTFNHPTAGLGCVIMPKWDAFQNEYPSKKILSVDPFFFNILNSLTYVFNLFLKQISVINDVGTSLRPVGGGLRPGGVLHSGVQKLMKKWTQQHQRFWKNKEPKRSKIKDKIGTKC